MKNKITFLLIFFVALCLVTFEVSAASKVTAVAVGTQTGNVNEGTPGSVTYTVTITCNNASGGLSTVTLNGSLPTGATASFETGTFTVSGSLVTLGTSTSGTIILRISNDASTPQGIATGLSLNFTASPDITSNTFTYTVDAPVPVELTSFSGSVSGGNVILKWNTATEVNNYGFEVHRSLKVDDWEVLGFVQGHGNSNSPKNYSFTDDKVNTVGKYFYRLKQIDNDGIFEFSETVEVNMAVSMEMSLNQNYPNPFNPSTTISFSLPEAGNISLKIYNSLGEEAATLVNGYTESGVHIVDFNAVGLPSGVYIYRLVTNESSLTKKMLFIK